MHTCYAERHAAIGDLHEHWLRLVLLPLQDGRLVLRFEQHEERAVHRSEQPEEGERAPRRAQGMAQVEGERVMKGCCGRRRG